jgi:Spy/CpxP family protein refolding chaperone
MSETGSTSASRFGAFSWLKVALVVSLAVNLLFIGGGVTRFLMRDPPDRVAGLSQVQIIPRKFFSDLDSARKAELLGVFRQMSPSFREGRRALRADLALIAAALDAEPYDQARVQAAIDSFSAHSENLAASGGQAALKLIGMLTPEERKLLATQIRQRQEKGRGRSEDKRSED